MTYTVFCPLSCDALFCFIVRNSGYQLGCAVAAVSAQWQVEHVKNSLQNIATEGTKHSVYLSQVCDVTLDHQTSCSQSLLSWEDVPPVPADLSIRMCSSGKSFSSTWVTEGTTLLSTFSHCTSLWEQILDILDG